MWTSIGIGKLLQSILAAVPIVYPYFL